jgi:hypothetical protein
MFNKLSIPVWAKVNLLKTSQREKTYETYRPGRIFSYYADNKNIEQVIVPRELYQDDIKAIKISALGSMYDNQVAFYYKANSKDDSCLNKLCVVSVDMTTDLGDRVFRDKKNIETQYFLGLYEVVKGQGNLINPDPYVDDENKYILEDFDPKTIAPIIAIVNPEAITDKTKMRSAIPPAALYREEERLQAEIAALRKFKEVGEKQKAYEMKQKKLFEDLNKLTKRIDQEEQARTVWDPFKKDRDILAQIHPFSKLTKRNVK